MDDLSGIQPSDEGPAFPAATHPLYKIAFTGHRPEKLPGHPGRKMLQEEIRSLLVRAVTKYGKSHRVVVICGGAQGIDTDAAREAYRLNIPYIVAIPFEGQSSKWETEAQERYQRMCRLASPEIAEALATNGERVRQGAVYVSEGGYEYAKYGKRDRWMVDRCDALIAVYDGSASGTGKTYDYAKSIGKPVLRIDPKKFFGSWHSGPTPEGLIYMPAFLSEKEEIGILKEIEALPWQTDLRRRTQQYGFRYDYRNRHVDPVNDKMPPLPNSARGLANRVAAYMGSLGHKVEFNQLIVNEYQPGQGISAHIDHKDFNGPIVSVSLLSDIVMDFAYKGQSHHRLLEARSMVALTGPARTTWTHAIKPLHEDNLGGRTNPRGRRISLTFRVFG